MATADQLILSELREASIVNEKLREETDKIASLAQRVISALKKNGKVVLFGNGGSAADAQHIAAELVGRFHSVRDGLPAIALTTNTSILTAISNDFSFEKVFARQVQALVRPNDIVVGISTGGMSKNVLEGIHEAKKIGAQTAALTGKGGGELAKMVDFAIVIPSQNTQRIQEAHITIAHIVCSLVEKHFSP